MNDVPEIIREIEESDRLTDFTKQFEEDIQMVSEHLMGSRFPIPVEHAYAYGSDSDDDPSMYEIVFVIDTADGVDDMSFQMSFDPDAVDFGDDKETAVDPTTLIRESSLRATSIRASLWDEVIADV